MLLRRDWSQNGVDASPSSSSSILFLFFSIWLLERQLLVWEWLAFDAVMCCFYALLCFASVDIFFFIMLGDLGLVIFYMDIFVD